MRSSSWFVSSSSECSSLARHTAKPLEAERTACKGGLKQSCLSLPDCRYAVQVPRDLSDSLGFGTERRVSFANRLARNILVGNVTKLGHALGAVHCNESSSLLCSSTPPSQPSHQPIELHCGFHTRHWNAMAARSGSACANNGLAHRSLV